MLTRSELLSREQSLRETKTLSVYLTGWTDDPAKRDAWRIELKNALEARRADLQQASHAEREAYDACVRRLWEHLEPIHGVLGQPGWVAFVTPQGVRHAEPLPVEMPLRVDWGDGIQLAPYVRVLKSHVAAVVAVVDAEHARLYRYVAHRLTSLGSVRAHKHTDTPLHMGSSPREGFHTGTRGTAGSDVADRARLVGRDRMLHDLSERLVAEAGPDGWILLGGIAGVVDAAFGILPEPEQRRARRIGSLDVHATLAQIAEAAEATVTESSRERDATLVDEVIALSLEYSKGCTGWKATEEALLQRSADRLVFTDRFLHEHPVKVERAVALALEQDADIEHVSGAGATHLDAEGEGIGARLRFLPTREQPPLVTLM
jgi:hypothetical protein